MISTKSRLLASAFISLALAACGGGGSSTTATTNDGGNVVVGGGGGGGATTGGNTGGTTAYALTGTELITSVDPAYYGSNSLKGALFDRLNTMRKSAGVGLLRQSKELDAAAQSHASYIMQNQLAIAHTEVAGNLGFTGVNPIDRAAATGYVGAYASEVIGGDGGQGPNGCVDGMLDSVYHQHVMLDSWVDVGFGTFVDASGSLGCVAVFGKRSEFGQLPEAGQIAAYPFDGQTEVGHTFYVAYEIPRPLPGIAGPVGHPIYAGLKNYEYVVMAQGDLSAPPSVKISKFELKDASGNLVPCTIITSGAVQAGAGVTLTADSLLSPADPYLVPLSPLVPGQTYSVMFAATVGGKAYAKSWSFTTKSGT